jgi:hypothetical protein
MGTMQSVMLRTLVAGAAALLPQVASAATIPVEYTVDAKDLKKNAPAGTMITIELHTDAACDATIATQVIDIDSLAIVEAVKSAKIAGGAKRTKLVRLHYVFTNVVQATDTDLFVRVTAASGITPVGGSCQAQEPLGLGGVVGPTGPTGPTGAAGPP